MNTRQVQFGAFKVGGPEFVVIAGPCSIETPEQFQSTADSVKKSGAHILRGGMFKLRTNPESFQGLGAEAFSLAREVKAKTNMPFISEVTDPRQISDLISVVDGFQVGSRNMHNYALLKEFGKVDKPIVLKRGFSGLIDEWILAAKYIADAGNENVILCERGVRSFETKTRNTFDLNAVAYIKQHTPFPVIADPSHGTGLSSLVEPMALAAAAAGADGVMIEVHPDPRQALSDGFQALNFDQFDQLMNRLKKVLPALDKKLAFI